MKTLTMIILLSSFFASITYAGTREPVNKAKDRLSKQAQQLKQFCPSNGYTLAGKENCIKAISYAQNALDTTEKGHQNLSEYRKLKYAYHDVLRRQPKWDKKLKGGDNRRLKAMIYQDIRQLKSRCPLNVNFLSDKNEKLCKDAVSRTKKDLDSIKTENQNSEKYLELKDLYEKVVKTLPIWEKNAKQFAIDNIEAEKQRKAFNSIMEKHKFLITLLQVKYKNNFKIQVKPELLTKDYDKIIAAEADLLKACNENLFSKASNSKKVTDICDIIKNWKVYFSTYIDISIKTKIKRNIEKINHSSKYLEEKGDLDQETLEMIKNAKVYVKKIEKEYMKVYKILGKKLPKDSFISIVEASKKHKNILKKAGKINRWNKENRYKDAKVTKIFRRALRSKKIKLIKARFPDPLWTLVKNEYNIPITKLREGDVLVQVRGEKFCRIYTLTARSEYLNSGKYQKAEAFFDIKTDLFTISRCR